MLELCSFPYGGAGTPELAAKLPSFNPQKELQRAFASKPVYRQLMRACLVPTQKLFTPSHRMFRHMHEALNVDKKTNCIVYMETTR
jgi:hypothetical protein